MSDHLTTSEGRRIAYRRIAGQGPGVVFLGGFKSDMQGTKALHLAAWARQSRRAFLRFDYSGHGESGGRFEDGCIGDWAEDARAMIEALTDGPQVLVGSSMGGWIALLLARSMPQRVAGLVTIAAAPDFTEDLIPGDLSAEQKEQLQAQGFAIIPNCYDGEPYKITKELLDEGRNHLLLRGEIPLDCPVRLIHGTNDEDVPWQTSLKIAERLRSQDVETLFVKNGDHLLSESEDLTRLCRTVGRLLDQL